MTRITFIIILSVCFLNAVSQYQNTFTRISMDDGMGLSSNNVTSIYQDEKGFLWVGTVNGLQRFDGTKFVSFSTGKPGSELLPQSAVSQILPAGAGRMWLCFKEIKEFGIFDPSSFTYKKVAVQTSKEPPPRAEYCMWIDSKRRVLLSISQYSILEYDSARNAFTENCFLKLPPGWAPSLTIYEDVKKRQYWVPCHFKGLCLFDEKSNQTWNKDFNPQNNPVLNNSRVNEAASEFYIDRKRRHWIFNWPSYGKVGQKKHCLDSSGIKYLEKDTIGIGSAEGNGYSEFRKFYESKNGTLWFYGLNVLMNYDANIGRFLYNKTDFFDNYGIKYDVVYQVMDDKDGSTWIATDNGLYYTLIAGRHVMNIFIKENNNVPVSITGIEQLNNGDYWLTTWGNGIVSMDKNLKQYKSPVYNNMPRFPNGIWSGYRLSWSIHQHSRTGKIWIGCQNGQLMMYDTLTKRTQFLNDTIFGGGTIRSIAEDSTGNLWLGTQFGRLVKWDGKHFSVIQNSGTIIYKVFIDKQGWVWLGCHEKGLYAVDPADGKIIQHYTGGKSNREIYNFSVFDIEQLDEHTICCASDALNIINKKDQTVEQVSMQQGLPSNTAKRVQLDLDGYLWIVTSNGLCRYDHRKRRFTPYGNKDGILNIELSDAADYLNNEGYMMYGVKDQLSVFQPSIFYYNEPPPDVVITDFKIFNTYFPVDSLQRLTQIKLEPDQNSVSFYFSALSFKQADKLTYYYMLNGHDENWIKADRNLSVNYALLPPGHYTFLVKCENREGIFSASTTSFKMYVSPPFWRTGWFISTMLMLVAMIAYSMHRLRLNRLLAVEKIRNRVARDLHDDMGSTLSTINILSSMAKAKMNSDIMKTGEYINKISDNSQRMMEAMDDIVWAIKPANDSMQKVVARMREFATNVLEAKDIELDFKTEDEVKDARLDMEARRDFFLFFKEAVNNAAKYSKCSRAEVYIYIRQKLLVLEVNDDGAGFDVKEADGGNGLGNMQKRADALQGKVEIISSIGNGTRVKLSVPQK